MDTPYQIVKAGTPALYKQTKAVNNILSDDIKECASRLVSTLLEAGGLGLAASQVDVLFQIMVMNIPLKAPHDRYDFSSDPNHTVFPLTIMINPSFTPLSEEKKLGWESCLSFPGYRGKVERYESILCQWTSLEGKKIEKKLTGFNARVFQHEHDHLSGIVYLERIKDFSTFIYIG